MGKRLGQLIPIFQDKLMILLHLSLGIFLFVLFFQPFPHNEFDFHYSILIKVGFAAIVFLFMFLVRVFLPFLLGRISKSENEITPSSYVCGFIIWVLTSLTFIVENKSLISEKEKAQNQFTFLLLIVSLSCVSTLFDQIPSDDMSTNDELNIILVKQDKVYYVVKAILEQKINTKKIYIN